MKKTTLFSRSVLSRVSNFCIKTASIIALIVYSQTLMASDCQMNCPGPFQVSVDQNCEAIIYPDSVYLRSNSLSNCPAGEFKGYVILGTDTIASGAPLIIPKGAAFTTYTLIIKDTSMADGNSCWTTFKLSDYLPPTIECRDTTLSCLEVVAFMPIPMDNCDPDPNVVIMGQFPIDTCSDNILNGIRRIYRTFDNNNGSDTCTQNIYFERIEVDSIICPSDTTLACDSLLLTTDAGGVDGAPHPSQVGEPMIDTFPLWSIPRYECNLIVTFEDYEVPLHCANGIKRKIFRTWSITEWFCSGGDTTIIKDQIIKLIDTIAPIIIGPGDILAAAGIHDCEATVTIPPARATDNCCLASDIVISVRTPVGFIFANGGTITLPAGIHKVTYFATDDCNNLDTLDIIVTVEDLSPPEPVCLSSVTTGLTTSGFSKIYADDMNKGSHDNCGPVYFKVLRMDDLLVDSNEHGSSAAQASLFPCDGINGDDANDTLPNGTQLAYEVYFDDFAKFCCADIGSTVMLVFRVYDYLPPHLIDGPVPRSYHETFLAGHFNDCMIEVTVQDKLAPQVVCPPTIEVSCEFDYDLDKLGMSFGNIVEGLDNRQPIIIVDPLIYGDATPQNVGLDGYALDNCSVTITERTPVLDVKCNIGYIDRTWDVVDDGGRSSTCTQRINITNPAPYVPLMDTFPSDIVITDMCALGDLTPDVTGMFDQSNETECSKVVATYEDLVFNSVPNVCFKVLRHWTVVDWCQFNSQTGAGKWEGDQFITVANTDAPIITSSCADRDPIISQDANCGLEQVSLIATATDICTPVDDLRFSYDIDLDDDNTIDDSGNTNSASGLYRLGEHRITWTVEDLCGNKTSCTFLFSILSGTKPIVSCQNMATVVDDNGVATIWVDDMDNKSAHPCGNPIQLSFSSSSIVPFLEFTCADLGDNPVDLYAIDNLGNTEYCTATVTIQDNSRDVCPDIPLTAVTVGGKINTVDLQAVDGASVYLDGTEVDPTLTDLTGEFAFYNMPMGGNYQVRPYNNLKPGKAVNTLDLIFIQRHLLGLQLLDSPYKIIAADVNNDGNIDVIDLINAQRVILELDDKFQNNTSWRFVNALYDFQNTDPLSQNFDEMYQIENLSVDMRANFIGVKIGDVNGSYQPSGIVSSQVNGRSEQSMLVEAVIHESSVDYYSEEDQHLFGLQLNLNISNVNDIDRITSNVIDINESNYNITESGVLLSWYTDRDITVTTDAPLFTIHYSKTANADRAIVFDDGGSAAYDSNLDELTIKISSRSEIESTYALYQNNPNPFTLSTRIGFDLTKSTEVDLRVYDISGKLVYYIKNDLPKGYNEFKITKSNLDNAGIYYYQLSSDEFMATKKMILME